MVQHIRTTYETCNEAYKVISYRDIGDAAVRQIESQAHTQFGRREFGSQEDFQGPRRHISLDLNCFTANPQTIRIRESRIFESECLTNSLRTSNPTPRNEEYA